MNPLQVTWVQSRRSPRRNTRCRRSRSRREGRRRWTGPVLARFGNMTRCTWLERWEEPKRNRQKHKIKIMNWNVSNSWHNNSVYKFSKVFTFQLTEKKSGNLPWQCLKATRWASSCRMWGLLVSWQCRTQSRASLERRTRFWVLRCDGIQSRAARVGHGTNSQSRTTCLRWGWAQWLPWRVPCIAEEIEDCLTGFSSSKDVDHKMSFVWSEIQTLHLLCRPPCQLNLVAPGNENDFQNE